MGSGFSCELFRGLYRFGLLSILFGEIGAYYEGSPEALRELFELLQVIDSSEKSGKHLAPDARYTLLFWPWVCHLISENNSRDVDMIKLFHDAFMQTDMPIIIPKKLRAGVIQTAFIVKKMCRAMENGRMRWSLKKRARYPDASLVFSIITTSSVLAVKDPFEHLFREKYKYAPRRYRKKRYRKRQKPASKD